MIKKKEKSCMYHLPVIPAKRNTLFMGHIFRLELENLPHDFISGCLIWSVKIRLHCWMLLQTMGGFKWQLKRWIIPMFQMTVSGILIWILKPQEDVTIWSSGYIISEMP